MEPKFAFKVGDVLKDRITGFEGVCMGITHYLTGCVHYGLCKQELDKEGKPTEWQWFDEKRIVSCGKNVEMTRETAGGPGNEAPEVN